MFRKNKRVLLFVFFAVFSSARGGSSSSIVYVIQIPFWYDIWYVTVVKQRDGGVVDTALKNGRDLL